jgi:hypothetical protein
MAAQHVLLLRSLATATHNRVQWIVCIQHGLLFPLVQKVAVKAGKADFAPSRAIVKAMARAVVH